MTFGNTPLGIEEQVLAYFRDPAWQFGGVAAALMGIWLARRNARRTRLRFRVFTIRLVSILAPGNNDLAITYRGRPVRRPIAALVVFDVEGVQPIRPEDFHTPITFDFGKDTALLSVEVDDVRPADLPLRFTTPSDGPTVVVEPLLLNPGDVFQFRCILDGTLDPRSSARIAGVPEIDREVGSGLGKFVIQITKLTISAALLLLPFNRQWAGTALTVGLVSILAAAMQFTDIDHQRMYRWLNKESSGSK
jgi:hypothetical protein